jgi:hypothetical protein
MKKTLIFLTFLLMAFSFMGCLKEDKVVIKETITPNSLNSITGSPFVLISDNAGNVFQTFTWGAVDYGFPSANTYTVQVDKKGNNFASPMEVVTVTGALTSSIKVGDFNKILLNLGLDPDAATDLEFRVKTVVNPNVTPVYSNTIEAKVTAYATSFPPIYMTGAATGGWGWDLYTYKDLRSSAPSIYQTIAKFLSGETFRFFKQTDWGPTGWNYPFFTGTISPLFENANDGDKNFRFIGTTGFFRITVDMKTKSVSMVAVDEPTMFMTGAAVGGWDWTTNFVQMTWKSNGIFQATTDFITDGAFRFFAQKDWGPTSYNYPYFSGGTVSPLFVNAADGDKNFKFVGTTGNFLVTINLLDLIVDMKAVTK